MNVTAAKTRLQPGETSIDRVNPIKTATGYMIHWKIRLHNGKILARHTQGPTISECRRRAKEKAKNLLREAGTTGKWTLNTQISEYMSAVTLPAIQTASIAPATIRRYMLVYNLILGKCKPECKHQHSLTGLSIRDAMKPRNLKDCLEEIAEKHGKQSAKHAKIIMRKYVAAQLRVDELLEYNPVSDLPLNMKNAKPVRYHRGGKALNLADYKRVINYLLTADPEDVEDRTGRQGRYGTEYLATERAQIIDFILTQASTGMRTNELATRRAKDCQIDDNFNVIFMLSAEDTKTHTGRAVPILDPRISRRIAARIAAAPTENALIFSSIEDPQKIWEPSSRNRRVAQFYIQMAKNLDLPVFLKERGHFWRCTLNTILFNELPEATRTRLLGHTAAVNRKSYTAVTDTQHVIDAAAILR